MPSKKSPKSPPAPVPETLARLEHLYGDASCSLDFGSPLELLVATILSAQCTDARVNMVTPGALPALPRRRRDRRGPAGRPRGRHPVDRLFQREGEVAPGHGEGARREARRRSPAHDGRALRAARRRTEDRERRPRERLARARRRRRRHARRPPRPPARMDEERRPREGRAGPQPGRSRRNAGRGSATRSSSTAAASAPRSGRSATCAPSPTSARRSGWNRKRREKRRRERRRFLRR